MHIDIAWTYNYSEIKTDGIMRFDEIILGCFVFLFFPKASPIMEQREYISTHHNKFHPHVVNILFAIEKPKNFKFHVSNSIYTYTKIKISLSCIL